MSEGSYSSGYYQEVKKYYKEKYFKVSYSPIPMKAALYPSSFKVLRVISFTERLLPQIICKKKHFCNCIWAFEWLKP